MKQALIFLVDTFTRLYLLILLLRLWLPIMRSNFRNPIAQGVLRYTSPAVIPLRRFIPAIGKIDTATVLVALLIQMLATAIILIIGSGLGAVGRIAASPLAFIAAALLDLALLSVWMFIIVIVVRFILGWLGRDFGPVVEMMNDLTEPLIRQIRRIVPPLGVIDLSSYITLILLIALSMALGDFRPSY